MENIALIHRLNRVQGQIEAIKKSLVNGDKKECLQTLRLLKAANNALKKFGEAYVTMHLEECIAEDIPKKDMENGLKEVINSAFSF
ncbi:MAG: metal-sensitive transcriptional regulator [Candidatus Sericytochromatia bacterium]|nr:metal-sensitive transcriptional regulator [Candidatus Sericytochromatia bacterium]